MDRMDALMWSAEMRMAQKGDMGAKERIATANKMFAQNGQSTLEEQVRATLANPYL